MAAPPVKFCAKLGLGFAGCNVSLAVFLTLLLLPRLARAGVITALGTVDFNGHNFTSDSFDSADPRYSTNWVTINGFAFAQYPWSNVDMTKANGDVAAGGTVTNALGIGRILIKGHVATGPNGSVSIGTNSSVGDRAWVEGGNAGIKPGYLSSGMNGTFTDVVLPAGATSWLPDTATVGSGPASKVNGYTYDYIIFTSGDFVIPGGTNGGNGGIYIGTNANVRLLVTGDINMGGQSQIHVAWGGSLKLYMNSAKFSLAGNGLVNEDGYYGAFYYFGLPVNTNASFGANSYFTGVIYCPEAAFTLGGGGNNTYDFIGAIVSKTVKLNGHFNFHFDENLYRAGLYYPPWIMTQPQSQAVLAGQNVSLSVGLPVSTAVSYQWRFGSSDIFAATNATLTLTDVTLDQAGAYSVIITNPAGSAVSQQAVVSVFATPAATLAAPLFSVSNQVQLNVTGVPGFNYAVEVSSNLSDWSSLLANTAPFIFVDGDAANYSQRFYRAVYLP